MFKKIANAYEKLIGKTKTEFYVEDVFANFFNNFFHKYKGLNKKRNMNTEEST